MLPPTSGLCLSVVIGQKTKDASPITCIVSGSRQWIGDKECFLPAPGLCLPLARRQGMLPPSTRIVSATGQETKDASF